MKISNKFIVLLAIVGTFGLFIGIKAIRYHNRIYPNVQLGSVEIGGLTKAQASDKLQAAISTYLANLPEYATHLEYHYQTSIDRAYSLSRKPLSRRSTLELPIDLTLDSAWLTETTATLSAEIDIPTVPPRIEVVLKNQLPTAQVLPGQSGQKFNSTKWQESLSQSLAYLRPPNSQLPIDTLDLNVTVDQIDRAQIIANHLLTTKLQLVFETQTWELVGTDLVKFIRFDDSFDKTLITEYLTSVAQTINRSPQDAKFQFDEPSGKVIEFSPATSGINLDLTAATDQIYQALSSLTQKQLVEPINLSVVVTPPSVTLAEINRLGIKERIGRGESTYKGSINSRVHNVALAASRINGTLIKPGEEFSFNQAVGEISAATGYQAAYIIQNGRTTLGDGGGVCQDSTTVFRAALNAGLPITSRRGHAYRVGYYEQDAKPGLDATVFSPSTDLRFVNDTPGHILIQTQVDNQNRHLTVDFYGASDGRTATITDHLVWDVTPPPPDVYIEDPTLAPGQVKQIDWKAAGAKAKFTYTVVRNGETLHQKTFLTTYKPWAAIYLRGPNP